MIIIGTVTPTNDHLPVEIVNAAAVEVLVSQDCLRLWINVNGVCVLRIKGRMKLEIPPEAVSEGPY